MKSLLLLLLAAGFSTVGNLLLKISKTAVIGVLPNWINNLQPLFFIAAIFYLLNLLTFSKVLETMPVSIGYPILASLGFVLLAITSMFFLNESMTTVQALGIATVCLGIFMLASGQSN